MKYSNECCVCITYHMTAVSHTIWLLQFSIVFNDTRIIWFHVFFYNKTSGFYLHFCHTCTLCRVELVVQFPARGSTQVLLCLFPGVLWLWHFLYSVGPHPVSSLHIYPLLCRRHSWWMRLAKQEMLTPPGHLVSPLVWQGSMNVHRGALCWCHSDSASVL